MEKKMLRPSHDGRSIRNVKHPMCHPEVQRSYVFVVHEGECAAPTTFDFFTASLARSNAFEFGNSAAFQVKINNPC